MNNKVFEVDIKNKIKNMKRCIKSDWSIPNNDVDILIREYEKQIKIIELMAKDISNFGKIDPKNIIEYYKEEVNKCLKTKKY